MDTTSPTITDSEGNAIAGNVHDYTIGPLAGAAANTITGDSNLPTENQSEGQIGFQLGFTDTPVPGMVGEVVLQAYTVDPVTGALTPMKLKNNGYENI